MGETRSCDVCVLVDGDSSPKEDVRWCSRCKAWICGNCRANWTKRARAALVRGLGLK